MAGIRAANRGGEFLLRETDPKLIFTPEDLTNEHQLIANTARQFIEKEVRPLRKEIENQDFELVAKLMRKAGELGLLAHSIPEEYGGLGLDKVTKGLVGEMVGPTSGYGVAHSNHTCIATLPITYFGTEQQKRTYLPKLASGEYIGAYCLTEPEAGSDALNAQTTAVLNEAGTHYILNGAKQYITNAAFSDTFITYAKVDGRHFTAFIVEKDFSGLQIGPEEKKMGIKGSSTCPVFYEDCLVPAENVLGEVGKGHVIALNVLNLGRFNLGSACMGAAKYAMELGIKYATERKQFQTPVAHFPASKEKFANMAARIYASESMQYRSAGLLEETLGNLSTGTDQKAVAEKLSEYAIECSVCKVYGSETLDQIADDSLQLHGGAGFIYDYVIEQVYRDSRINRIFEGTNEINRLLLPTQLLRKIAKGEMDLSAVLNVAQAEIRKLPADISLDHRGHSAVNAARQFFQLLLGACHQLHGDKLIQEQEMLMNLANIAIELYAMESAVLRTEKVIQQKGSNLDLKKALTQLAIDRSWEQVQKHALALINEIYSGNERKEWLRLVSDWTILLQSEKANERNRKIADAMIKSAKYAI
ncbi:alkylation response protein AidB-like acyl-CoA dehydrogenase [Bacillus ectoiniformans]|uniref:acyl-CoA dehydrogenase family protein n=1 Tax=Bacillus ectoiniformans TaxID=1494429 RepID=UPI00195EEB06|nr:acyl-CoA dehydrogenase family protein [Bacillus ectoiniformans]MBM7647697.1 alkylation response protein AidB-like acyl-CoA dehydrogenase [Bacillus ectoiniformans]